MKTTLDLYTDYLLSSFGATTATGLSSLLDEAISHDDVTRFVHNLQADSQALWQQVKPVVRQAERAAGALTGCLIVDDSIIEKAYTDENGLISFHRRATPYDHSKDRYVKGINLVSLVLQIETLNLPVAYELVVKTLRCELKQRKVCWRSERTKNEMFRDMFTICLRNQLAFTYVLCDSWYTNAENIKHILSANKHLIGAVKSNLEVAVSLPDKKAGKFVKVSELPLELGLQQVYIRQLTQPVLLCKDIFINEVGSPSDGKQAVQYLLATDLSLTFQQIITTYQRRWGVEEYRAANRHKSVKQNASAAKVPLKTITTQANHLFASLCAYIKLEKLKLAQGMNHFALKTKLYLKATQAAFKELQQLKLNLA